MLTAEHHGIQCIPSPQSTRGGLVRPAGVRDRSSANIHPDRGTVGTAAVFVNAGPAHAAG